MFKDALKGIRIADFSWVWAGPYATSLLSYMGAEVIKIESRGRVDQTRKGSIMNGDSFNGYDSSPTFNNANLNKQGVSIDITKPEGSELARRLVEKCDIVVANMRPGKMDKLGLGYQELVKVNPNVIMLESSGFGCTGPYRGYAGFAPIFASFGGLAYLTGYEDGAPNVMSGVQDMRAGTMAAFILITALVNRQKTGKGQYIDLSSSECLSALVGPELMEYTMNKRSPFRCGNQDAIMAPHNCYRCKGEDKWISIAVATNEEWEALRLAMGDPDWARAEEYTGVYSRWQHRKELDIHMTEWTVNYTHYELMELLQGVGVAAMPSFDAEEILKDPHTKERELFTEVDHPALGKQVVMNPAWKLSETPARIRKPGPLLGEDNYDVFENLLGMQEEEIKKLEEAQIIW
ncbi:CoA transferase [[Clostridium] symbiosum]|uniref:CaiB/BaiF CoA transferase family protein n=1 Tax=Clostridium symbiosum TaxID=1512 RepID=UPI001D09988B|nr:CoA transferase [[Clostridium] symbiosum]MCB6610017.1 CoA transferase [[Clostridium] symbiosum]MCB6931430.1 CoA transferase [[Clostridium] symbiosum]